MYAFLKYILARLSLEKEDCSITLHLSKYSHAFNSQKRFKVFGPALKNIGNEIRICSYTSSIICGKFPFILFGSFILFDLLSLIFEIHSSTRFYYHSHLCFSLYRLLKRFKFTNTNIENTYIYIYICSQRVSTFLYLLVLRSRRRKSNCARD